MALPVDDDPYLTGNVWATDTDDERGPERSVPAASSSSLMNLSPPGRAGVPFGGSLSPTVSPPIAPTTTGGTSFTSEAKSASLWDNGDWAAEAKGCPATSHTFAAKRAPPPELPAASPPGSPSPKWRSKTDNVPESLPATSSSGCWGVSPLPSPPAKSAKEPSSSAADFGEEHDVTSGADVWSDAVSAGPPKPKDTKTGVFDSQGGFAFPQISKPPSHTSQVPVGKPLLPDGAPAVTCNAALPSFAEKVPDDDDEFDEFVVSASADPSKVPVSFYPALSNDPVHPPSSNCFDHVDLLARTIPTSGPSGGSFPILDAPRQSFSTPFDIGTLLVPVKVLTSNMATVEPPSFGVDGEQPPDLAPHNSFPAASSMGLEGVMPVPLRRSSTAQSVSRHDAEILARLSPTLREITQALPDLRFLRQSCVAMPPV